MSQTAYVPDVTQVDFNTHPPRHFIKLVADHTIPELVSADLKVLTLQLIGENAYGVNNTGNINVQLMDGSGNFADAKLMEPGDVLNFSEVFTGPYNANTIRLRADTDGDGVRVIYT